MLFVPQNVNSTRTNVYSKEQTLCDPVQVTVEAMFKLKFNVLKLHSTVPFD